VEEARAMPSFLSVLPLSSSVVVAAALTLKSQPSLSMPTLPARLSETMVSHLATSSLDEASWSSPLSSVVRMLLFLGPTRSPGTYSSQLSMLSTNSETDSVVQDWA